jgi:hypothetical protein
MEESFTLLSQAPSFPPPIKQSINFCKLVKENFPKVKLVPQSFLLGLLSLRTIRQLF